MTLRETVSKIQGYEVTETHARIFASEQFGVLASFIRGQLIDTLSKGREAKERAKNLKATEKRIYIKTKPQIQYAKKKSAEEKP